MNNATLVVMAAGMGSRFGGLKQIEPIGPKGEAILDFSVFDAKQAGFDRVVFVIKKAIEHDFRSLVGRRIEKMIDVDYAFQELDNIPMGFAVPKDRTKPWGTGHAVLCCKGLVHSPFAVINADDFYGRQGFQQISKGLQGNNYCMVGYRLKNTVTKNGFVSRGVCSLQNGMLKSIKEHTKIAFDCSFETELGEKKQLSPDTIVSMNLWGFKTDFFDCLENSFNRFLNENKNSTKAELHLPSVVDDVISEKLRAVEVLTAEDKWYGVTYKEDKQAVVDAIAGLVEAGFYDNL